MSDFLEHLNEQDVELLLKAPLLVCILIGGADGTIDRKEIREAVAITRKKMKMNIALAGYFKEVEQDFEDKLKVVMQAYPFKADERSQVVAAELAKVNAIWSNLPKPIAIALYDALRSLAAGIAGSSGGLLGYNAVGTEEARFIDLEMLENPSKL